MSEQEEREALAKVISEARASTMVTAFDSDIATCVLAWMEAEGYRKDSAPAGFAVGDRVSWDSPINTDVVFGYVDAARFGEVRVKWADGSGPTWHKTDRLIVLDKKEQA